MLPLYILSLGVSVGLVGVYARRLLAVQGFVPNFETGLVVAIGAGAAYAALQLFYVTAIRVLKPTRDPAPLFAESLSLAAALILIPYLLHVPIPWPYAILVKMEPLIYLAAFAAVHMFLKLFSFFCAIQSRPAGRIGALGWAGACAATTYTAYLCFALWHAALLNARETTPEEIRSYCIGGAYAPARRMPEGAIFRFDAEIDGGRCITVRWANPPEQEIPLQTIYVTVRTDGTAARPFLLSVELSENGWTELRIPPSELPPDLTTCTLLWSVEKDPDWVVQTGLRPMAASDREMLVSGPFSHQLRIETSPPNIVILVVEGLGAEHVRAFGYDRATTTCLDALAERAITFPYAYTPAPEAASACMTLLTGVSPLTHGYLGRYQGPLPEAIQTLPELLASRYYTTAAFTEGVAPDGDDLFSGSGFERGFELFDAVYPMTDPPAAAKTPTPVAQIPAGSRITLDKAADWIEAHRDEQFMLFVRLRELRTPQRLSRYGEGFLGRGRTPTPMDIYDTALADVDLRMGAFLDRLNSLIEDGNTCFALTSTYGFDFSEPGRGAWRRGGIAKRNLSESCLRVPLFFLVPRLSARERISPIALQDVAPTLLALIGAQFSHPTDGVDLLSPSRQTQIAGEAISMMGEPLALSLRSQNWRYIWQSGLAPFSNTRVAEETVLEFIDMNRYRWGKPQADNLIREPLLARQYCETLREYLKKHTAVKTAATAP